MAKKEPKKPAKKTQKKGTAKAKKVAAKPKKAAAPAKKATSPAKKRAAPNKKAKAPVKKAAASKKKTTPQSAKAAKSYSVAEFAGMTYLTENGVMQWLQQGLLKGQQDPKGNWQVDASNLEVANVKRLIR